jgi:RND family efflux transporter MFP subunit
MDGPTPAAPPAEAPDRDVWRGLSAESDEAFGAAWLALIVRQLPGATAALLLLGTPGQPPFAPVARWPQGGLRPTGLAAAAERAIAEGRGVARPPADPAGLGHAHIAYPILLGDQPAGAVAVEIALPAGANLAALLRQLRWAAAWPRERLALRGAAAAEAQAARTLLAVELLAAALEQARFADACRVVATDIATRFACDRVGIGLLRRGQTQVAAISHSARFGKRMDLVRRLAAAMDEAVDQRAAILFPEPEAEAPALATRAHADYARAHAAGALLTVPMLAADHFVGAVTLERPADRPFTQEELDAAGAIVALLGPLLAEKRANDRWLVVKAADAAWQQARRLLGPGHYARKLALAGAAAAFAFGYLATGEYRVAAEARVEGTVRRAVVAPFDGYVAEAAARAGDLVRAGDLLAALDDRDLTLDRLRWVTERQQRVAEYDQALGARRRADAVRIQAQIEQAEAQIRLVDEQLSRARLVAPRDGLVVSGDLSQSVGAAVRRGDLLFEVSPLDDYRVELRVDESQVAALAPGQAGRLVLAALPHEVFPITLTRITPVAEAREGHVVFRVEAALAGPTERLRPGMEGAARIEAGEARLVWIWTRPMLVAARMALWRWVP